MDQKGVDIIIPIYNGYDDVQVCLNSIKKYTDLSKHRVIVINDHSTDARILPLLRAFSQEDPDGVIVIDNPENKGFSYNINKGMASSDDRDVVLLNSDTQVTRNWVEKLTACAYLREEIGTVTPLSNSATLCSIPNFCQDNPMPEGLSVDAMAEIVERCSLRLYPEISVAVGFCMFIKRAVISEVGVFDAETFGKGYGEENDFCHRAGQMGFLHVMCDDTFIYHKGTASFTSQEKQKLIESHAQILTDRYARQEENNHRYCTENPDQIIRDNMDIYISLRNGKKNLLYMSHLDFRQDAKDYSGGVQYHIRTLTQGLCKYYNVFVVARDGEYIRLTAYTENREYTYRFYVGAAFAFFRFRDQRLKDLLDNILELFRIELVHVHHVAGLSLDIFYSANERKIPLIFTVHDYFTVAPNVNLLDANNLYMGENCQDRERWKKALWKTCGIYEKIDYRTKWQEEFGKVLAMCEEIVFPTESVKTIWSSYYPNISVKKQVISHGFSMDEWKEEIIDERDVQIVQNLSYHVDNEKNVPGLFYYAEGWLVLEGSDSRDLTIYIESYCEDGKIHAYPAQPIYRPDIRDGLGQDIYYWCGFRGKMYRQDPQQTETRVIVKQGDRYFTKEKLQLPVSEERTDIGKKKIAFIGNMTEAKGSALIRRMVEASPQDTYAWYVCGDIADNNLFTFEQKNLYKLGPYQREEITKILKHLDVDLVCILSVWPETFCYTLSEAIASQIPVLGIDLGAVGDRIREHGYGWTVPSDASPQQILAKIDDIFRDTENYESAKKKAETIREKSEAEMLIDYQKLYDAIRLDDIMYRNHADAQFILKGLIRDGRYLYSERQKENREQEATYQKMQERLKTKDLQIADLRQDIQNLHESRQYRIGCKLDRFIPKRKG